MQKLAGSQLPKLLATHPSPEDRMKDLGAYAQKVMPLYLAAAGSPSAGK
jgi:predicted Zn-dependent protease